MAASSWIMCYVAKPKSSQTGFITMSLMTSTVRSQSNREPLRCGGLGDLYHECAAGKSAVAV